MNQMKKEELEMTISDSDRIECAIRHIQTAVDVDPWAAEIAVGAMERQMPMKPKYKEEDRFVKNHFSVYPYCPVCEKEVVAGNMHCVQCGQAIDWEVNHERTD